MIYYLFKVKNPTFISMKIKCVWEREELTGWGFDTKQVHNKKSPQEAGGVLVVVGDENL